MMADIADETIYYLIVEKEKVSTKHIDELPSFCINAREETKRAYILLTNVLKSKLSNLPEIFFNKHGKPYFKNGDLYFNYSHSTNYIALAISTVEVGIDIEEKTRIIKDDLAKKYLDNIVDNDERIKCWVKKEAYSKFLGYGLQYGLNNINLDKINDANYYTIENEKYFCAIFYEGNEKVIKEIM